MEISKEFIRASKARLEFGDSRSLSRRFARGELVRVRHGVYLEKSTWLELTPWARYLNTAQAIALEQPNATFCFETAGRIWQMCLVGIPQEVHIANASKGHAGRSQSTTSSVDIAGSRRTVERTPGFGVYRHFYAAPFVMQNGFRVTPLAQTAVDLLGKLPFAQAVTAADHVISSDRFGAHALSRETLTLAATGLKSATKCSRITEILDFADADSGSAGESISRANMHLLGFPPPELQTNFTDSQGFAGRSDFFWRAQRLIGEFDGAAKYLNDEYLSGRTARETVLLEKKREDRLRAMGYRVVRWDWSTAIDPNKLMRTLLAAGLKPQNSP
ncbi:hypothetical protein ACQR35_09925 [Pseudarthrobacter sp. J1738]|uniref:hypothetical protein n=1 Tax=unclassified Pseudarthrobacter TaxID=2647000 RepID=UPI003D2B3377